MKSRLDIATLVAAIGFGTSVSLATSPECREHAALFADRDSSGITASGSACDACLLEETLRAGTPEALQAFLLARPDNACAPLIRRALVQSILEQGEYSDSDNTLPPDFPNTIYP